MAANEYTFSFARVTIKMRQANTKRLVHKYKCNLSLSFDHDFTKSTN